MSHWLILSFAPTALMKPRVDVTAISAFAKTTRIKRLFVLLNRVHGVGYGRTLRLGAATVANWKNLKSFRDARSNSVLAQLLYDQPELWSSVLTPFVSADWSASKKIARIVDHCDVVQSLGLPLALPSKAYATILKLPELGPGYHITLDQPEWLVRDGLLTLSLWQGIDRLFSLAFTLSSENGALKAYVGGVQGRRQDGVLDAYRVFTKAAHGMRPRDMTIEIFKAFCRFIGVFEILGVSDRIYHQRSRYSQRYGTSEELQSSYDQIWLDRGGELRDDGFFILSAARVNRPLETVSANKRPMYKRRFAMLDQIEQDLAAALVSGGYDIQLHD